MAPRRFTFAVCDLLEPEMDKLTPSCAPGQGKRFISWRPDEIDDVLDLCTGSTRKSV